MAVTDFFPEGSTQPIGQVWLIDPFGFARQLGGDLDGLLEGVTVVPDNPARYGPLAGKIVIPREDEDPKAGGVYAVDAQGQATFYPLGLAEIEGVNLIPAGQNFYGVDYANAQILGIPAAQFAPIVGDLLLTQEFPDGAGLYDLSWNGTALQVVPLTLTEGAPAPGQWEQVTFAPAGVSQVPGLVDVISTAFVSDAPLEATGMAFEKTVGQIYIGAVASFVDAAAATDPDATFTATIDWGDGTDPSDGTVSRYTVFGNHEYTAAGTYTVHVTVVDDGGSTATTTTTATVTDRVPPPDTPPSCNCACGCGGAGLVQTPSDSNGGDPAGKNTSGSSTRSDGTLKQSMSDGLGSGGQGTYLDQSRSWTNHPGYPANNFNGNGTVNPYLPYVAQVNGNNTVAVVTGGSDARYFDLRGGTYVPHFFLPDRLTYDSATGRFTLVDGSGDRFVFYGYDAGVPFNQRGQLFTYTDPAGHVTQFHYGSDRSRPDYGKIDDLQRSTMSGTDTVTETYRYDYASGGLLDGLVTHVTLERQTNNDPPAVVRQVEYAYYDGTEPYGNGGDLKTATTEDENGSPSDTQYYRYYTPGDIMDDQGNTIGYVHGLKYAYDAPSYDRLRSAVGDPTAASDDQVAPYAMAYYQYDAQQRVTEAVKQGSGCSSCTGGQGTFHYQYEVNPLHPPPGYNT